MPMAKVAIKYDKLTIADDKCPKRIGPAPARTPILRHGRKIYLRRVVEYEIKLYLCRDARGRA